jgi:dienelactone hydrolase
MNLSFAHLGSYSDWPAASSGPRTRATPPSLAAVRRLASEILASPRPGHDPEGDAPGPAEVKVERRWRGDGLTGEEISYFVGYGPRTLAWILKPDNAGGLLPGVIALHGHDGFKYYGKEKIADGPGPAPPAVAAFRQGHYEGRAFANDLAREGFVVMIPDVFGWGSRRFPLQEMPSLVQQLSELTTGTTPPDAMPAGMPYEITRYNAAAWHHEHLIEKYCALLGTTLAAVVAHEDRLALRYLRSRPDTTSATGSIGLSGGGCRSALLRATSKELSAAVVVGMMGSYDSLIDHNVIDHTWMLMPAGLPAHADWPDLAACQAPASLLVQYNRHDDFFPLAGAEAAHERITAHYADVGATEGYAGWFYNGPHKFDRTMQADAFNWLREQLH